MADPEGTAGGWAPLPAARALVTACYRIPVSIGLAAAGLADVALARIRRG